MATEKYKDSKYAVMVCIMGAFLIIGSAITEFSILDIVYLIFITGCLIRYLYLSNKHI